MGISVHVRFFSSLIIYVFFMSTLFVIIFLALGIRRWFFPPRWYLREVVWTFAVAVLWFQKITFWWCGSKGQLSTRTCSCPLFSWLWKVDSTVFLFFKRHFFFHFFRIWVAFIIAYSRCTLDWRYLNFSFVTSRPYLVLPVYLNFWLTFYTLSCFLLSLFLLNIICIFFNLELLFLWLSHWWN